ncbi:MAG: NADH:ubiquinone reductase (Na(+)-transporting) subunit B [Saprospiraceae bacterium]|nr:NADH:ubiquinone reductase (Na(+)-transporting) subunit B [Bacteroidia bacterium]MBT8229698.1 NADH:ubiquinone reductase (Na(+)-transporting) subunit B [Bacteroidia bacterium]NNF21564.1 NADH:ubiquinone reductase (Na(+)-transporting) subunit B [Saprospiraceae bacterium]
MGLLDFLKRIEPDKKKQPFLHTAYDAFFTFAYVPSTTTKSGTHIKDGMDLKRTMVFVVLAMQLAYVFGTYNIGHQHFVAMGQYLGFLEGFHLKLAHGLIKLLPLYAWTMIVGLGIEFYFAYKKGHAVEEGFLVTGALIPLIMPPDIPIWILCVSVAFAVILGKEAFGGTGMNIWNVALLSRVFVFFAYPTSISGDEVWVSGFESLASGSVVDYQWGHDLFNWLFGLFDWTQFDHSSVVADGYSGATPLALAYQGGWENVTMHFTEAQMWWGTIPGSIGETSKPLIIIGALMLIVTGIASWRIMLSMLVGAIVMGMLLNAWGATPFMEVPWLYQLYMGSFFFAMAFMATDPVTACATNKGKIYYGLLIGMIGMLIRVINPAYPEGWMLAILFLNTFAPLIDHFVVEGNMKKRMAYAK